MTSPPQQEPPSRLQQWTLTAVVVVAGVLTAGIVTNLPMLLTVLFTAGVIALALTLYAPFAALCALFAAMVLMTDSAPAQPGAIFAIPDPDVIEGLPPALTTWILLLFLSAMARRMLQHQRPLFPGYRWLISYGIILALAAVTGWLKGTDSVLWRVDLISFVIPALCLLLCLALLTSRRRIIILLSVLTGAAVIKALILLAFYAAGRGWPYHLTGEGTYMITTMDSADLLAFITVLLCLLAAIMMTRQPLISKMLFIGLALPLILVILFSYRRAQWLGMVLSLGLMFWWAPTAVRRRFLGLSFLMLIILVAALIFGGTESDQLQRITSRTTSIVDRSQDSNAYHLRESKQVLEDLASSPLFGLGLGSRHTPLGLYENDEVPTNVVHNTFLYLWMKLGLPGLLFFAALGWVYLRTILRSRPRLLNGPEWTLMLPLAASTGLWLAMFLTGPVPWYLHQTNQIALFAAMVLVLASPQHEDSSKPAMPREDLTP